MGEKGLYYPVVRRIITIVSLLVIISGFLAVYYLVYLPQEHAYYNLRTFRVLHEIAQNFQQRVENYGTVYSNTYISQKYKDKGLCNLAVLKDTSHKKDFDEAFRLSFTGDVKRNDNFHSSKTIKQDSVFYKVTKIGTAYKKTDNKKDTVKNNATDSCVFKQGRSLSDILQPLISIHADVFESVLLIKQTADANNRYDSILYESEKSDIANINADSLFKNKSIEEPVITDLNIEGVSYKLFVLPFKMHGEPKTFILAGIVPYDAYREQSQNIPVYLLLSVCFVLIILLVALPFLKIFFLSAEENIKLNDVRAIITVIFVVPFFVTLVIAGILISMDTDKFTNKTLASLQYNVQKNFYNELKDAIHQAKHYDSVMKAPSDFITVADTTGKTKIDSAILRKISKYDSLVNINNRDSSSGKDNRSHRDSIDLKDIFFYPQYYKNITSLHWMDANGNDIAAWNFNKLPASYFRVADRPYFQEIKYNKGYILKDSIAGNEDNIDTFSVLPVLSRLTGEYIFNIAIPSNTKITKDKKSIAVGVSSKMYSVYNTIVPAGFAFCIIDEKGNIVCHSDTARSLQENIFEECSDSFALRSIINHKDITMREMNLYEQPVKMLIKPLPGLPYYLVTYYNKRGSYLYIFHILAFVFICEAALLFFVSLFSYFIMLSDKKNSKLFFTHSTLSWLKPSPDKKNYYIKNSIQFITCLFFTGIICLLFAGNAEDYYLYTLNAGLLLPLFSVTSYYITKNARTFFQNEKPGRHFTKAQYLKFLGSMPNILILYFVSIIIFILLQSVLFFNRRCEPHIVLETAILVLVILIPFIVSFIAGIHLNKKIQRDQKPGTTPAEKDTGYLFHFIVSLLLGVTLTSIIPSMIFISYAFREEKTYQLQAFQIDLAKKIQQRRTDINPRLWQTKLNVFPLNDTPNVFNNAANEYVNTLKFEKSKGIYLLRNDSIKQLDSYKPVEKKINCSPFYKKVTQYLFLPPDHDEFFDGLTNENYYYWQNYSHNNNDSDVLALTYNNYTDNRKPPAFSLTAVYPHPQLFKEFSSTYISLIILLALFMIVFYKIIYSVSIRLFLVGFFEEINGKPGDKPDKELQKQIYAQPNLIKNIQDILGTKRDINFKTIRDIEDEKISDKDDADGFILELHFALLGVYENLWNSCTDTQKYTLYDFATDGFTNYKKVLTLHQLYKAGLIIKAPDGNITLVTKSFRNFLITKETSNEIKILNKQGKRGSWGSLRTVFYIVLIAVAIFIFLSQEEASKRLITIVTSLGALLPAMLKLFDKSSLPASSSAKSNE